MTPDGKIGLLFSFLFIVVIAFLINGPAGFFKTEKPVIETAVPIPPSRSILIDQAVEQVARQLEPAPLRPTVPPAEERIIHPIPTALPTAEMVSSSSQTPVDTTAGSMIATSVEPSPVNPSAVQIHTVQQGENLALIAVRYYGKETGNTRAVIQKLYQVNQDILPSPDIVRVGDKLTIPPLEKLLRFSAENPKSTSPKPEKTLLEKFKNVFEPVASGRSSARYIEYVVQPGDRLWDIAQQHFGDGRRYLEIVRANPQQISDPDNLPAGIRLKIPVRGDR